MTQLLLSQSKWQYAKFLENKDTDVFAEAGEMLWEALKAHLIQTANVKTSNYKTLTNVASQMGEPFNELFFHCYHFHSWYRGEGVPNNLAAEKKLYSKSVKSFEKIICGKTNKRELEKQHSL